MNKTIYQSGVEVFIDHLNYTETSKTEAIQNIVNKLHQTGAVYGLIVSATDPPTNTVTIDAGYGYSPAGDYVEIASPLTGITVSTAIDAVTYVGLLVTATSAAIIPSVYGIPKPTRAIDTVSAFAIEKSAWDALPDKSNYLLLAKVVGQGGLSIVEDCIRRALLSTPQILTPVAQPVNIKGVAIRTITPDVTEGTNNYLAWQKDNKTLQWISNGTSGVIKEVAQDGIYALFLQEGNINTYVEVDVNMAFLSVVATQTEQIEIANLYGVSELMSASARDNWHRSMMGTGTPSLRNPHGQNLDDFDPGVNQNTQYHQYLMHSSGILNFSSTYSSLEPSWASDLTDTLQVAALVQTSYTADLLLVDGILVYTMSKQYLSFNGLASGTYYVVADINGVLKRYTSLQPNTFLICTVTWSGSIETSTISDQRVFGTTNQLQVQGDKEEGVAAIETLSSGTAYTLLDNMKRIRRQLQRIIGSSNWNDPPTADLLQVSQHNITANQAINVIPGGNVNTGTLNVSGDTSTFYSGGNNTVAIGMDAVNCGRIIWDSVTNGFVLSTITDTPQLFLSGAGTYVGIGTATLTGEYTLRVNGTAIATAWEVSSDKNLKTDIQPINNALNFINQLEPVSFRWKDLNRFKNQRRFYGLIAQDVDTIMKASHMESFISQGEGEKSLPYTELIAPIIKAIQELSAENKELRATVLDLQHQVQGLSK